MLVEQIDEVKPEADANGGMNAMIAKCPQATRCQSRLKWCTEVIAVSAVVIDTAVDTGSTKASIGMAISTAPNPAALRTANAPVITSM